MNKITLTPIEQKYIGTCYPLPDRQGINECNIWKNKLQKDYSGKNIEFDLDEFKTPFPFIYTFLTTKQNSKIQKRFEGISDDSHIKKLYNKAENIKIKLDIIQQNLSAKNAYLKLLEHYEGCSVKVADLEKNLVWGYGGIYNVKIDKNYFEKIEGKYAILHGKSENGLIAIRNITLNEFNVYIKVFEKIQNSENNPFKRFKTDLEEMLNSNLS